MKTSMNSPTWLIASRTTRPPSAPGQVLLRLVEEPAPLEQLSALLGAHLHVSRSEQEHLVGDALHAAVQRVCEAASEVHECPAPQVAHAHPLIVTRSSEQYAPHADVR